MKCARWVVLATGAVPQAPSTAGLCGRHTPSGVALRGYVKNDALVGQITQLHMVWHPRVRGRERVSMQLDGEVDGAYPAKWLGRVVVHTHDGRTFTGRVDEPKADPAIP